MREHGVWEADSLSKHQEDTASNSHVIRLRGPWQCELCHSSTRTPLSNPDASYDGTTEILTVKLPVDWSTFLCERTYESMVWRRSFGRPTNLSHRERVELVISQMRADVVVWLNDNQIEPIARTDANARFEVTDRLDIRSQLALEVRTPSHERRGADSSCALTEESTAGPFGEVCLEILIGG